MRLVDDSDWPKIYKRTKNLPAKESLTPERYLFFPNRDTCPFPQPQKIFFVRRSETPIYYARDSSANVHLSTRDTQREHTAYQTRSTDHAKASAGLLFGRESDQDPVLPRCWGIETAQKKAGATETGVTGERGAEAAIIGTHTGRQDRSWARNFLGWAQVQVSRPSTQLHVRGWPTAVEPGS